MLGDLTGAFKQHQPNPQNVNRSEYEEFMQQFFTIYKAVDPNIERRVIVETLADMPETAGEFMPLDPICLGCCRGYSCRTSRLSERC